MWLWLRGRDSVLLLDGRWLDSPGLHVEVSLGKILNLQTAPDVLVGTWHGSNVLKFILTLINSFARI